MALTELLPLDPPAYRSHPVHGDQRVWAEVNCSVDIWIELLNSLGLDPVPGFGFALSAGFEGDQWRFLKFQPEDLKALYGIDVLELNPWRGVERCIIDHLSLGQPLTVEVDAWFLPDTAGTSYHRDHVKTTIIPNAITPYPGRLGYFHNAGYFELSGPDYAGLFRDDSGLPPYIELIRMDRLRSSSERELADTALALATRHVADRPDANPIRAMRRQMEVDRNWLVDGGLEAFHAYAFATLRQCGAGAELAADLCVWLSAHGEPVAPAIEPLTGLANAAKAAQFNLARVCAGRPGRLEGSLDLMEICWDLSTDALAPLRG